MTEKQVDWVLGEEQSFGCLSLSAGLDGSKDYDDLGLTIFFSDFKDHNLRVYKVKFYPPFGWLDW